MNEIAFFTDEEMQCHSLSCIPGTESDITPAASPILISRGFIFHRENVNVR
jgi:hypothetical protein